MNKSRRNLCRHVGLALCLLMIFTVFPVPVAALSYSDERAETMLFSDLPMGKEKYYLYADLTKQSVAVLSSEEKGWLAEHGEIRVGFLNNDQFKNPAAGMNEHLVKPLDGLKVSDTMKKYLANKIVK